MGFGWQQADPAPPSARCAERAVAAVESSRRVDCTHMVAEGVFQPSNRCHCGSERMPANPQGREFADGRAAQAASAGKESKKNFFSWQNPWLLKKERKGDCNSHSRDLSDHDLSDPGVDAGSCQLRQGGLQKDKALQGLRLEVERMKKKMQETLQERETQQMEQKNRKVKKVKKMRMKMQRKKMTKMEVTGAGKKEMEAVAGKMEKMAEQLSGQIDDWKRRMEQWEVEMEQKMEKKHLQKRWMMHRACCVQQQPLFLN